MITVKFKILNDEAIVPSYAKHGDAGMDLTAIGKGVNQFYTEYHTGLAVEIPEGYVGLLFPRSSCSNKDMILSNCVGVIDSGYRGEIKARFKTIYNHQKNLFEENDYEIGDKIVQLIVMPYPQVKIELVNEFTSYTERGEGGYGSTGR